MRCQLQELVSRERLFRRHIAEAFRVPEHIKARWDLRLTQYEQEFPQGQRYGHALGFENPDWLAEAEEGLDACANFLAMHAQFGSTDRRLEAQLLQRTAELTTLLEQLRTTA